MFRRDLLKLSPLALASAAAGHIALAQTPEPSATEALYNVRRYGATGDGKTVDTPAINRAIEAVAAAGGGTLLFPAGTYLCFTIRLRSNVDLFLSPGCTILAADSPRPGEATGYNGGVYDPAGPAQPWEEYQDYGHNHWPNSLFYGEGIRDFAITGPGLIHGKGLSYGQGGHRGDYTNFTAEQPGVGNKAIALKNCRNVLLRDFSILKGGHFGILATGVDNITIDNLVIDTDRDGMDIDCCRNVRVSNCTVNSPWDDGICPKSSYALGYNRATENVTITNCYVTGTYELGTVLDGTFKKFAPDARVPRTGRIKCGTESNGGFRNIAISNCVFEHSRGFALESVDGALCEDISFVGVTMRGTLNAPLFMRLGARMRGPKDRKVGTLKRILISNVTSYDAFQLPSILSGVPGFPIEDVKISDVYLHQVGGGDAAMAALEPEEREKAYPEPTMFGAMQATGFFLRHVRNLEMSNIEIATEQPDARAAFALKDVEGADFFRVRVPRSSPAPVFALEAVSEFRVFGSQFVADKSVAKVESKATF